MAVSLKQHSLKDIEASVAKDLDEICRKELLTFEASLGYTRDSIKQVLLHYIEALINENKQLQELVQPREKMEFARPQVIADYAEGAMNTEPKELNAAVAFEHMELGSLYSDECTAGANLRQNQLRQQSDFCSEGHLQSQTSVGYLQSIQSIQTVQTDVPDLNKHMECAAPPVDEERGSFASYIRNVVNGPRFDIATGMIILVNLSLVFLQLELQGYSAGHTLGIIDKDPAWMASTSFFETADAVFNIVYAIELGLRVWVLRLAYFCDAVRVIDFFVVVGCIVDVFILQNLSTSEDGGFAFGRLVRLFRLLRLLKLLRFMLVFGELRILLRTLRISIQSLVWSMLLVGIVVLIGGMLMLQLSFDFISNDSNALAKRQFVYREFGTSLRATYAMFEATFTAGWLAKARTLVEDVSPTFAIFWVIYVIVVNFALMRIVSALFLKQTMAVATQDAEKVAMSQMQKHTHFISRLRELFAKNDVNGNGMIDNKEFEDIIAEDDVLPMLEELDLDKNELSLLFQVLSSESGEADYEEFLGSLLKMHRNTRSIDIIQLLHEQSVVKAMVSKIAEYVKTVELKDPTTHKNKRGSQTSLAVLARLPEKRSSTDITSSWTI